MSLSELTMWSLRGMSKPSKSSHVLGTQKRKDLSHVSLWTGFLLSPFYHAAPFLWLLWVRLLLSYFPKSILPLLATFHSHPHPSAWQGGRILGINPFGHLVEKKKIGRALKCWDCYARRLHSPLHGQLVQTKSWFTGHLEQIVFGFFFVFCIFGIPGHRSPMVWNEPLFVLVSFNSSLRNEVIWSSFRKEARDGRVDGSILCKVLKD